MLPLLLNYQDKKEILGEEVVPKKSLSYGFYNGSFPVKLGLEENILDHSVEAANRLKLVVNKVNQCHQKVMVMDDVRKECENGRKEPTFLEVLEETHNKEKKNEDGTMVQPSPVDMTNMWTAMVGGPKKGKTYGTGVLQSSSSPSLFPNSSSTLQTIKKMKAMKKQIVELTQQCAASDAKFAKFEELVKKHMPQVFHDEEESEPNDN
ncbi:hypothetical protein FXO37_25976 [Capsicum annuum]|nr:hypothetical protein FXO37_25976 [Capsicum annuum]